MYIRNFIRSKTLLLLFIFAMFGVPNSLAQSINNQNSIRKSSPIIITEKGNYQINEIAQIYGMNFQSYERIRLNIKYIDESLQQEILLNTYDIYADRKGYISADWQVFDVNQLDTNFIVEATGTSTGITTKTGFSTLIPAATSVTISQCANSNAAPQNLDCPNGGPTGWVTGIVGNSKASHFENDSIAYRNVMEDLVIGNSYKWTVEYDTTKGSLNAIDYLTTYNRTITNANPCQDGATVNGFCTAGAADSTFAIPIDPVVANGRDQVPSTDDITQAPGDISAWGATITAVSAPTYTAGFPVGNTTASVDITFTANNTTAVIAWGGHISTRSDWGQTFGSVNITGAPYHTSNGGLMNLTAATTCCGGSQDLQLQAAAVLASAKIIIIKHATPPSAFSFDFLTTNLAPGAFSLVDNSLVTDPMQTFDNITVFDLKTIAESNPSPYILRSIVCTVDIGTGGTPTPIRNMDAIEIDIKSGDQVTCTFNNDFVTAAAVSVSGKVIHTNGRGIGRALVSISDGSGNPRTVMTNQFGYYSFDGVTAGETYFFNVRHRRYIFETQVLTITDSLDNLNFTPIISSKR